MNDNGPVALLAVKGNGEWAESRREHERDSAPELPRLKLANVASLLLTVGIARVMVVLMVIAKLGGKVTTAPQSAPFKWK